MINIQYNFKFCKIMDISAIQKMICHIFLSSKSPEFIKVLDKTKFESLNLIFGYRNFSLGKLNVSISLRELHDIILKKPNQGPDDLIGPKSDISVFTEENIKPFIFKRPMDLYTSIYKSKKMGYVPRSQSPLLGFARFKNVSPHWLVAVDCEMVETVNFHYPLDCENSGNANADTELFESNDLERWGADDSSEKIVIDENFTNSPLKTPTPKKARRESEIGRITILGHDGKVLYDKFVKPENFVSDYRTEYSGLTADLLCHGVSFETMQNEIMKIIGRNTVIVGHSLENELKAMKVYHELLIDTAHLFRSPDNEKVKLRNLVYKFLKMSIQAFKHCSAEDASATLELLSLKVKELESLKESKEDFEYALIRKDVDYREIDFHERAINTFFTNEFDIETEEYPNSIFMTFFEKDGEIHFSFL